MANEPPSPSSSTSSFLPTTTLLAVADGSIASHSKDARSHTINAIGGYPTFPSIPASASSSGARVASETFACKVCDKRMPLLTQVYCPPEGGDNDRNIYVFGCPRGSCQRKEGRCVLSSCNVVIDLGNISYLSVAFPCDLFQTLLESSVRAFRASVLNQVYAEDAAAQRAKQKEEEEERKRREKINPFSVSRPLYTGTTLVHCD